MSQPFATGSVSVGLHVGSGTGADKLVERLLTEARVVDACGFDGVTMSEHHAGFAGYLPQPLSAASWVLGECGRVWAAPAPTLLGLRSPRLLAEELAWLAARYPGRLGVALAPGYARSDFEAVGVEYEGRLHRFPQQLVELMRALSAEGPLAGDHAVASGALDRSEVLVAANSSAGVSRAARHGIGVLFPGGESADRLGRLVGEYRAQGGAGPAVAIGVVWIGEGAHDMVAEAAYRAAAAPGMRQRARFAQGPFTGSCAQVAEQLGEFIRVAGVSAINLRFRRDAAGDGDVGDQIAQFAADVLGHVRAELPSPQRRWI